MTLQALAIGRLVPVKNFPLLLTAWVDIKIPLQIAGDGPERADLHELCRILRLNDRVRFLGHRTDIDVLLDAADLVIVSSRKEGFGYVTLEALQHRCVVIATPTGIAAELIPDHYLSDENPRALASTVNQTLSNFATAQAEFEVVWEYALSLTAEKMAEATQSVYEFVLESR